MNVKIRDQMNNHGKTIWNKVKIINKNQAAQKNSDICVSVIFGRYGKSFISERKTGH